MSTENIVILVREDGSREVSRKIEDIGGSAKKSKSAVDELRGALAGLAGVLALRELQQMADTWTKVRGQVAIFSHSVQETNQVMEELYKIAQRTRQPIDGVGQSFHQLSIASSALGASQNQILKFTEAIGMALAVQGTSSETARGGIIQLGQAMNEGIVRAQEYNSMINSMPIVLKAAAQNLEGVDGSLAKLRKRMLEGKLYSKDFFEAVIKGSDQIREYFDRSGKTIAQSFTIMRNAMTKYVGDLDQTYQLSQKFFAAAQWGAAHINELANAMIILASPKILSGIVSVTRAVIAMNAAMLANPWTAAAAAVTMAVTALALYRDEIVLVEEGQVSLGDYMRASWDYTTKAVKDAAVAISTFFGDALEELGRELDVIFAAFGGFGAAVKTGVNDAIAVFVSLGKVIGVVASAIPDVFREGMASAVNVVRSGAGSLVNGMIDVINAGREKFNLDPIDHVQFEKMKNETAGATAKMLTDIKAAMDSTLNVDYIGELGSEFNKQLAGVNASAAAIAKARHKAESEARRTVNLDTPNGEGENFAGSGKKDKTMAALEKQLRAVVSAAAPAEGAILQLAHAEDVLQKARDKGIITGAQYSKYLTLVKAHYEEMADPLGKLNRELDEQRKQLGMNADARQIESQMYQANQALIAKGIVMTQDETKALREKYTSLLEYTKLVQAQDQLLAESVEKRKEFTRQLQALKNLLADPTSGFTQTDAQNAILNMMPEVFEGTELYTNKIANQYKLMFGKIDELRGADLISEQQANELRLLNSRKMIKELQEATISAAQLRTELGTGDWSDMMLVAISKIPGAFESMQSQVSGIMGNLFSELDSGFQKAWGNISNGFDDFAKTLKDAFKNMLAQLANILITRPLVLSIATSLSGGSAGGSVQQQLLSAMGGSGGQSGSLGNISNLVSNGSSIYNWMQGTGSNLYNAYQSGGFSGLYNYGANAVSNWFSTGGSAAANSMAQGSTAAGYGQQLANWNAANAAGTWGGAASSLGSIAGGITGAIQGYQNAGFKGAVAGGIGGWGGGTLGTMAGVAVASALSGTAMGAALGSIIPGIGTVIGAALGAAFGSKLFGGAWMTKDAGLSLGVENGDFQANSFTYQKKKGGLFSSNKKRTLYGELPEEQANSLQATYDATQDSVLDLYKKLNVSMADGVLDGLQVARLNISTKDRTDEEIQKDVTQWFADLANAMTTAIDGATGSGLGLDFEGLKTFVTNLYSVNEAVRYLNVGMYDLSVSGGRLAESLSAAAGGLETLQQNTATYFAAFYTDAEKNAATMDTVKRAFEALNVALPDSREGFRKAVEGLDITTESGQKMFATMMSLAGAADGYYKIIEAQAQSLLQMMQGQVSAAYAVLQRSVATQKTNLQEQYELQEKLINAQIEVLNTAISNLTSMSSSLKNALGELMGTSDQAADIMYAQGQATLQTALAISRAGGSLSNFEGLSDALEAITSNSTDRYSNSTDYQIDQARNANAVAELGAAVDNQLTAAEKSLKAQQDYLQQAKETYDMEVKKLDAQLDLMQAQIDAMNGIDNNILTVADAIKQLGDLLKIINPKGTGTMNADSIIQAAYQTALGRNPDAAGAAYWKEQLANGNVTSGNLVDAIAAAGAQNNAAAPNQVQDAYAQLLGRAPTAADMAYWTAQVKQGNVHDVYAAIKAAAVANGQIPAYANGGNYPGGMALMGEYGPELVNFRGGGRVFTASQTQSILNGSNSADVVERLDALIEWAEYQQAALETTAINSSKQVKKMDTLTATVAYTQDSEQ